MDAVRLSVFLLVQIHFCWSQNTMVAPSQPIIVSVGSDVTLPCRVEPVKDLRDMVVEWARHDLTPRYVHVRRDAVDLLKDQNSLYLGRTSLSESRLQQGDMSLSVAQVRPSDRGTYTCYLPQINVRAEVSLIVVSVAPPSVTLTKERSGSPVLRCESRGWYPEPELEWLDSEGTVLLRTEAQRGASDELFTVSSRLSVEQRLGNTFTCRVKEQESGQSREAQLTIADELLEVCASCSVAWVLFGLLLCVIAAAAAFALWKFQINKTKTTQNQPKDCEGGAQMEKSEVHEETVPMLRPEEKKHLEDDKLTEYQEQLEKVKEELNFAEEFSQELTGTKNFLTTLKEKINQQIYQLSTDIKETKKKKKIPKMENLMGEYKQMIENLDPEISKMEKLLQKTSVRKGQLEGDMKHFTKLKQKQMSRLETTVQPETEPVMKENGVNEDGPSEMVKEETEAIEKNQESG